MNAHTQAIAAYRAPSDPGKSPRAIEYDLFAEITSRLRSAASAKVKNFPKFAEALNDNRKLWSELAFDLAGPDNLLPESLRAQLLGIAQFTLNQTDAILMGNAEAGILIDLNIAIMRGLNGQGGVS